MVKESATKMAEINDKPQLWKLKVAEGILEDLWEDIGRGHAEDGLLQTAVDTQIFINRIVWKLNELNGLSGGEE